MIVNVVRLYRDGVGRRWIFPLSGVRGWSWLVSITVATWTVHADSGVVICDDEADARFRHSIKSLEMAP